MSWSLSDYDEYGKFYADIPHSAEYMNYAKSIIFIGNPLTFFQDVKNGIDRRKKQRDRLSPILRCPACSGSASAGDQAAFDTTISTENQMILHMNGKQRKLLEEFEGLKLDDDRKMIQAGRFWTELYHKDGEEMDGCVAGWSSTDEHFIMFPHFFKYLSGQDIYHAAVIMEEEPNLHQASIEFPVKLYIWKNKKLCAELLLFMESWLEPSQLKSHLSDDGSLTLEYAPLNKKLQIILDQDKSNDMIVQNYNNMAE